MDRIKQPVVVHSTNIRQAFSLRVSAGPSERRIIFIHVIARHTPRRVGRGLRAPEGESNALCVSMLPELPHEQSSTPARTPIARSPNTSRFTVGTPPTHARGESQLSSWLALLGPKRRGMRSSLGVMGATLEGKRASQCTARRSKYKHSRHIGRACKCRRLSMRGCPRARPRCTGIEHDEAHEYEAYEWPSRAIKGNQGHVPARGSERTVEMAAPDRGVSDVASHRLGRARAILVAWLYG
jgi:hypothetical protein